MAAKCNPAQLDSSLHTRAFAFIRSSTLTPGRTSLVHCLHENGVFVVRKGEPCFEGDGLTPEEKQVSTWKLYFTDPAQWWDNRRSKKSPRQPDFKHKKLNHALWLGNRHKPDWVEAKLAKLDAGRFGPPEVISGSIHGDLALEVQMCTKLCEDGPTAQAVNELTRLVHKGCQVDNYLYYRVLKRCTAEKELTLGRRIHSLAVESGFEGHKFVATHLIGLYASLGRLEEAMQVFTKVSTPDAYNWATIIFAHARYGEPSQAIHLYRQMRQANVKPDNHVYLAVLKACASAGDLAAGKDIHAQVLASPKRPDIFVQSCLVDMYAKCGSLEDARKVFDMLPRKNVVTWNSMIAGYAQQGMGDEALCLYSSMQQEGITEPDSVTFLCLLQACAAEAALPLGRQLHEQIQKRGLQADVVLGTGLVDMYAKCGSMSDAQKVFDALHERNTEAWSALIAGYTRQGNSEAVFDLFHTMRQGGVKPNSVTFLSVLTVCSHVGLVDKGREYFGVMSTEYSIAPCIEHYICMLDLLGRAGLLEEALGMAKTMPFRPNAAVWRTLLGACRKWGNVEVGRRAFEFAMSLNEKDPSAYSLMSNIYASAEMWDEAKEMQARRLDLKAWKQPGQSWWADMGGVVHSFLVGDKKNSESDGVVSGLEHPAPQQ